MLRILIAVTVGAYGATAAVYAVIYWRSITRADVDAAVRDASVVIPPWGQPLMPVVAAITRPAWAAVHGLAWPVVVARGLRR